jgi:type IV secretory pathway VirJ component
MACPTPVIVPTPDGGFAIVPARAQASPTDVVRFVLVAAQGAPPPVTWAVTGGGTVAQDGTFTAPGCASPLPATITLTATSGSTVATTTVTVADKVTSVAISPSAVTLAPGATQVFTATVRTVCFPQGAAQNIRLKRSKEGSLAVVP